jgi:hypothetical protein
LTIHWIAHVLGALISVVTIDASTQHRVFANASSTNPRKTTEVTGSAVHHVGVATLTVHWIAHVLDALVAVVTIDVSTQHRVLADPGGASARKSTEVTGHPSGHVRMRTLAVRRVAGVGGALVLIVTIDASTQHRVFARAGSTHARKPTEVARHSIGYQRVVTLAIRRVAGVGGALVLIIAVDGRAQHAATNSTGPRGTTRTARAADAACAAGATPAASTTVAEWRRFTTGVGAIKELVAVVVSAIFAVPWLGSFDARSSKVTRGLTAAAHADHPDPQTGSACRNAPHRL